jgi:predicted nucleic acid-binding Zn ribbon protein
MPVYTYRREDGTTFDFRQKFTDEPLQVDPTTGQHVTRVIQAAGVIFKGSGFYVNDSKSASRSAVTAPPKNEKTDSATTSESKSETKTDAASSDSKPKAEKASTETVSKPAPAPAAAD